MNLRTALPLFDTLTWRTDLRPDTARPMMRATATRKKTRRERNVARPARVEEHNTGRAGLVGPAEPVNDYETAEVLD